MFAFLTAYVAHGQIYVANYNAGTIGEYNFDGSVINASLITGLNEPTGIAVSGSEVFVSNGGSDTIGVYTTSGATINASLIAAPSPASMVISGTDLFFVSYGSGDGVVEEYTTSGVLVNPSLVKKLYAPSGLAVSGSNVFVANNSPTQVEVYSTDGTPVNTDLISTSAQGLAVNGNNIYLSHFQGSVAEYTTTGALVNSSLVTDLSNPSGLVVSGDKLYVENSGFVDKGSSTSNGSVGVYTLSGEAINTSLISGLSGPVALAIVPEPVPEPSTWSLLAGALVLVGCFRVYRSLSYRASWSKLDRRYNGSGFGGG